MGRGHKEGWVGGGEGVVEGIRHFGNKVRL